MAPHLCRLLPKEWVLVGVSSTRPALARKAFLPGTISGDTAEIEDSKSAIGSKLKCLPGDWRVIANNQTALLKNYAIRWPLLTGFGYLLIGIILLLVAGVILRFPSKIITAITWVYLYLLTSTGRLFSRGFI